MKRILGLDFARVIMTFGIVAYHFSCYTSANLYYFNIHANGVWGGTYNASFFALSGLCLFNKYSRENLNIINYYYNRWKSIIIPYALVFLYAYFNNVASTGRFFYLDIPNWILLLSFIGEDGYVEFFRGTYFITGVWFVGAIILIYIIYPILNTVMKKNKVFSLISAGCLYELVRVNYSGGVPFDIHPVVCILSFMVGMFLATFISHLFDNVVFFLSFIASIVLIVYPIGFVSGSTKQLLLGWILLVLFSNIGYRIKLRKVNDFIEMMSHISYPVILIHLPVLHKFLLGWNDTNNLKEVVVLFILCVVLCILGMAINIILRQVFSWKIFTYIEKKI
ncbi:acyltransferase family protein [Butyrivibrio sp. JL13D10]|uniref:acyltransferase family protein n=1 Tax=Butyrivibrio sp. JL13D10 TaxID=3236815 RepID=UPI0038B5CD58